MHRQDLLAHPVAGFTKNEKKIQSCKFNGNKEPRKHEHGKTQQVNVEMNQHHLDFLDISELG